MILDDILKKITENQENVAYTVEGNIYRYKDLYKYVCNIYKKILEDNPTKKPVIVYGEKEIYMKATFLACSFAGMAYVPVDCSMASSRVDSIISQVKPGLIVGDFEKYGIKSISKNQIEGIMERECYEEIDKIYMEPNDIYYIIFTSGSTGIPKGVKITYNNLNSCVNWLKEIANIKKGVILNQASFSFDLSVADLYLSLISASEHYILEKAVQTNFKLLFDRLKASNATFAVMTPSFAELLLLDKSFNDGLLPNLRTILFCGEKLLETTVRNIYARFKNITIINSYGPTECTFAVTSIEIDRNLIEDNISIGMPKKDVKIFIVDENLKELEDGKVGEILIAGKSVADGYIGAQNNTFINYNGNKAYLTGDLGYKKNGNLYYHSRKDKQIKYKGYRIELSDIESNLYSLNYIEKAVVIPKISEENKVIKILAFVKLKEGILKNELEIRKEMLNKIPDYMCPSINIVERFPLNKNGKCDERKLLEDLKKWKIK